MSEDDNNKRRENLLYMFLFHFVLFLYPVLSFIWRHDYPFFTTELATITLLVLIFSLIMAVVLLFVRHRLAIFLSVLLASLVFILQFNLLLVGTIATLFISLAFASTLKSKFYPYALLIIVAMTIGAYFDNMKHDGRLETTQISANVSSELPPVVHIILDAFIGTNGLPDYPASKEIKYEVDRFFEDFGFSVFPSAYSRYSVTGDSLYSAFNFINDGESRKYLDEFLTHSDHVMNKNATFQAFEEIGYRFSIYQSQHLDFCQSNIERLDRCWTYRQPNVASIQHASKLTVRVKMLLSTLLTQSRIMVMIFRKLVTEPGIAVHDPLIFPAMQEDLLQNPEGKVFFAHMLLPHGPFAYLHDCSVDYESSPTIRYGGTGREEAPRIYEYRTMKYFEQMACALLSLRQLFDEMKKAGIFDKSIIVLHGDHGSKIVKREPEDKYINQLTKAEYRAHFSLLFAVKYPNQSFEIDQRILPLSVLMEAFTPSVTDLAAGEDAAKSFTQNLSALSDKHDPYVFHWGSIPMKRVDINIFEE